jgi:pimeloyl-ACP methyl ester carboxylesterase
MGTEGNLEFDEECSRDGPARATQNPATPGFSVARNPPETRGRNLGKIGRRSFLATAGAAAASLPFVGLRESVAQEEVDADDEPLVIKKQGSFTVGGRLLTANGQTYPIDHLYAQFEIPVDARDLPLVMVHGALQTGKGWESTPDGREGLQSIFVRRGFAVYVVDIPRRGRAGFPSFTGPLGNLFGTQVIPDQTSRSSIQMRWISSLLGPAYPEYYPNTQFPKAGLDEFMRSSIPDVQDVTEVVASALAALFERIGPAILVTHSQGGVFSWPTRIKSDNVRAIINYEPGGFVFPDDDFPPPVPLYGGAVLSPGDPVPPADFQKLAKIPIQIVWGDFIPSASQPNAALEFHRGHVVATRLIVAAINKRGGDASFLSLPEIGITGNTHFIFSDLNSVQIANLLSQYLHEKGLDRRGS